MNIRASRSTMRPCQGPGTSVTSTTPRASSYTQPSSNSASMNSSSFRRRPWSAGPMRRAVNVGVAVAIGGFSKRRAYEGPVASGRISGRHGFEFILAAFLGPGQPDQLSPNRGARGQAMLLVSSVKKLIEDLSSLCRTQVLSSRSPSAYESPSFARAREYWVTVPRLARSLSEKQVKADKELRRSAEERFFVFQGIPHFLPDGEIRKSLA